MRKMFSTNFDPIQPVFIIYTNTISYEKQCPQQILPPSNLYLYFTPTVNSYY